jgi:hypothetical protein
MRIPIGKSFLYGQLRDNDHGSVLATQAAKKIDAGEFEYKITGKVTGSDPTILPQI